MLQHSKALGEVTKFIREKCGGTAVDLNAYPELLIQRFLEGYKITISDSRNISYELVIFFDEQFPWHAPKILAPKEFKYLKQPHVEKNGLFCLLEAHTPINPYRPIPVLKNLLFDALQLIENNFNKPSQIDFLEEFYSYFETRDPCILSLLHPEIGDTEAPYITINRQIVIAENSKKLELWAYNHYSHKISSKFEIKSSVIISLTRLPYPSEYPDNYEKLVNLVKTLSLDLNLNTFTNSFANIFVNGKNTGLIIFKSVTPKRGVVFFGCFVKEKSIQQGIYNKISTPILNGFRKHTNIPYHAVTNRMKGHTRVSKHKVQRVDSSWVNGRDHNSAHTLLNSKKVIIIGCGSVGSLVTKLLIQSGVSNLTLIDHGILDWPNISRHSLGAEYVNKSKSEALAIDSRKNFPHIGSIKAIDNTWEAAWASKESLFLEADLIISTVGDWNAESKLNSVIQDNVIYAWTEAHAAGGHAVLINKHTGCFACQISSTGRPKLQITNWPEATTKYEPHCGAAFETYGVASLSFITSMVASLALEYLTNKDILNTHKIWCGKQNELVLTGGNWSEEWKALIPDRLEGGFLYERKWKKNQGCYHCGKSNDL